MSYWCCFAGYAIVPPTRALLRRPYFSIPPRHTATVVQRGTGAAHVRIHTNCNTPLPYLRMHTQDATYNYKYLRPHCDKILVAASRNQFQSRNQFLQQDTSATCTCCTLHVTRYQLLHQDTTSSQDTTSCNKLLFLRDVPSPGTRNQFQSRYYLL